MPKMQEQIQKFEAYKARYLTQHHQFISERMSPVPREVLLVIDFKENIKYPILKEEEGRDFYRQKQISCQTIYALEQLFHKTYFSNINKVIWWSNGGPHFKNRAAITKLLYTGFSYLDDMIITINFFSPSHRKSTVDGIFGFFAHLLKDWRPNRGLQSIEQIHSFFQRCCSIVEMCTNSGSHYEFEMFASLSSIVFFRFLDY